MSMTRGDKSIAPWIQTFKGRAFDFENMHFNEWDAEEIATVLSRTLRFAGHTKWPYTVAQHCVLMSRKFEHRERRLLALVHDAPEVFTGDITSPLKRYLREDSKLHYLEDRIWSWISSEHGWHTRFIEVVKHEDLRALATELRDLMLTPPRSWIELPSPWNEKIEPWCADYARDEWLKSYGQSKI